LYPKNVFVENAHKQHLTPRLACVDASRDSFVDKVIGTAYKRNSSLVKVKHSMGTQNTKQSSN
jgi:hypothetical protein